MTPTDEVQASAGADTSGGRRGRRWFIAICGAFVVIGGAIVVLASVTIDHWNGWTISITNSCGHDLYADDGEDGIPILDGQTISWDGASRSGDKTILLWRSSDDHAAGVDPLVVSLHGDSVLEDVHCP